MTTTDFWPGLTEVPHLIETDDGPDELWTVDIGADGPQPREWGPADPWAASNRPAVTEIPRLSRKEARRRIRTAKATRRGSGKTQEPAPDNSPGPAADPAPPARPSVAPPLDRIDPTPPARPSFTPPLDRIDPAPPVLAATRLDRPASKQTESMLLDRDLRGSIGRASKGLAFALILAIAGALWYFSIGTLIVSRGTALLSGWDVTSISTGSMAPALSVGDLVAFDPGIDPADLKVGNIIVFDNPVKPGTTLVHRLAAINGDGTFTTKGDANQNNDSTPVPTGSIKGVVKMVSPFGGYPTTLLNRGEYLTLALFVGLLLTAALIVHGPEPTWLRGRTHPLIGNRAVG